MRANDGDACSRAVLSAEGPEDAAAITLALYRAIWSEGKTLANAADVVAAIYNEGIRGRGATFETAERSANEVLAWLEAPDAERYPFVVAEDDDGRVLGWARASSYRPRACYATIGEFSIYVAGSARGRGVGDALMREFLVR